MHDPDSELMEAWLAGRLPADEAAALEASFEEAPSADDDEKLLIDLDLSPSHGDQSISRLISEVKTQFAEGETSNSPDDSWRELLQPAADALILGVLGHYEVLGPIASGGMGIVVKARDPELDRLVAIKILSPERAGNRAACERFLREARAAAKLEHENILPIHGVHEEAGVPYFAMRLANGGTLQDALENGEVFDTERLCNITSQTAAALEAAHRTNLVHRDIKPANILFDKDGAHLWVCDFGIAQSTDDPSQPHRDTVAGTPQYMSPEQAEGKAINGRSDLFSLGAMLYRCATGQQAFAGNTTTEVLKNVATVDPDFSKSQQPAWFNGLLTRLLAKDPDHRPASAAEILETLENQNVPSSHKRRGRSVLLALAAMLAIAWLVLQLPVTKSAINRHLATGQQQTFFISGRIGAHASIGEAITNARNGDRIELPAGAILELKNLEIPIGKELTLTATRGGDPITITSTSPGATAIIAHSQLHLKGLVIKLRPTMGMAAMLQLHEGGSLTDCHFSANPETLPKPLHSNPCAVEIYGGKMHAQRCRFEPSVAVAFRAMRDGTHLQIDDCEIFVGGCAIQTPPNTDAARISITASNSHFTATHLIRQDSPAPVTITADTHGCTFNNGDCLGWINTTDPTASKALFHWQGNGNRHPIGGAEVRFGKINAESPDHILPIDVTPAVISIAGRPDEYLSLAEAINAAPDGATILLTGDIDCTTKVYTPAGKELHFKAAEGSRPTVFTRDTRSPALVINSPTTVSGIRFTRTTPAKRGEPIVAIDANGGSIVIDNCEFLTNTADYANPSHRGLGIRHCESAEIRDCYFRIPGGHSMLIDTGAKHVRLIDSHILATTAIQNRGTEEESSRQIALERCILLCGTAITLDPAHPCPPMEIKVTECVSHLLRSGFSLADIPENRLGKLIKWSGKDNIYRGNTAFVETYRLHAPAGFQPTIVVSDSDRSRVFSDTESITDDNYAFLLSPLQISELPLHLLTPETVLENTDPNINSPAIDALRNRIKKHP